MKTAKQHKPIVIKLENNNTHASIAGHPETWGCGRTANEATGSLVRNHPEKFNVKIEET